jgi:hypothetical protein
LILPVPYYFSYYTEPPAIYTIPPAAGYALSDDYTEPLVSSPVTANQKSPAYIDQYGHTCRNVESTYGGSGGPVYSKACLQPDGSWRIVE